MAFEKDEKYKYIDIEIIDDNEWEPDEVFFVKISLDSSDPNSKFASVGRKAIQEVTIINDDGEFSSRFNLFYLLTFTLTLDKRYFAMRKNAYQIWV